MIDHFAVLGASRRPWLDPERLKERYQQLAFACHPDRQASDEKSGNFSAVTEAYRVLSNPKLRLQHLLSLEAGGANSRKPEITSQLADTFMTTAALVTEVDSFLRKKETATSTLGKSLLLSEAAGLQKRVDLALEQLQQTYDSALEDLKHAGTLWDDDRTKATAKVETLSQQFAFLDRWIGQLREKQFQLSS